MIRLRQATTGLLRDCPTGFSWSTFALGPIVPLARGWYGFAIVHLVASVMTVGFATLAISFFINRWWLRHLLEQSYVPFSQTDRDRLEKMGLNLCLGAPDEVVVERSAPQLIA